MTDPTEEAAMPWDRSALDAGTEAVVDGGTITDSDDQWGPWVPIVSVTVPSVSPAPDAPATATVPSVSSNPDAPAITRVVSGSQQPRCTSYHHGSIGIHNYRCTSYVSGSPFGY